MLIAHAELVETLAQLVSDTLPIGLYRRHSIDKSSNITGQIMVSVLGQ